MTAQPDAFQELAQRIIPGSRLLRAWPLTGGVSAEITALEIERRDGSRAKLVVRRHGEIDRNHNPHVARDEYRLLHIAQAHGLATPKPYYFDESCDLFPTPLVVIEFIEGETVFAPGDLSAYLAQMVGALAQIHTVKESPELAFLLRQDMGVGKSPATLDASMHEADIREALAAWPFTQDNASALLHGDYWPGNVLWKGGKIAAVIDWEDARVGDPLADLGNARLEVLWAFGTEAMTEFTRHYQSLTAVDLTKLPYWDLRAALRPCGKLSTWGFDAETDQRMRERHALFVDRALATKGELNPRSARRSG
ncbi:MAG: phosphotransferase family protein [Thermomicrobiales bacterium]